MIQVHKEVKGDILAIKIVGSIEENVDFAGIIGNITVPNVYVYLKEVPRMNSVGVKSWVKYFQSIAAKGVNLKFLECSTAIVEQINLISNFTCGAKIESIYVPFCCTSCGTELLGLFKSDHIKKINLAIPDLKCSKCGGKATFDDIPEEYFGFLMR